MRPVQTRDGASAVVVRVGLALLAGVSLVVGGVILVRPKAFFDLAWVNMGMAYNPHLLLDHGAQNLAIGVILAGAAVSMSRAFVRTALAGYAVWSIAHFLIHLRYRAHFADHASASEANLMVTVLGIGTVLPLVLLALTFIPRRAARGSADE